ncbi:MAG: hypothetical protein IT285_10110 [Bdellovibrionales bacterium]|nr:hypothetical protein [Bdellovibrionales bacterium]
MNPVRGGAAAPLYLLPLFLFLAVRQPWTDASVWIAWGSESWKQGTLAPLDTFSVYAAEARPVPAWLTALLYFGLHSAGGAPAVWVFHAAALAVGLFFVYRLAGISALGGLEPRSRIALYLFWAGTFAFWSPRPAMLGIPLLAGSLLLLSKTMTPRRSALILGLQALWSNLHASFPILTGLLAWRALSPLLRRERLRFGELLQAALAAAATLLNPWGIGLWSEVLLTQRLSSKRGLVEWLSLGQAIRLPSLVPQLALFTLLLGFLIWLLKSSHRTRKDFLSGPMIPLLLLGLTSIRQTVWAFVALPGILVASTARTNRPQEKLRFAFPIGLILAGLGLAATRGVIDPATRPIRLLERIALSGRGCPVLAPIEVASSVWLAAPGHRTFVDPRISSFSDEDYRRFLEVARGGPGAIPELSRHGCCWAIVSDGTDGANLRRALKEARWVEIETEADLVLWRGPD